MLKCIECNHDWKPKSDKLPVMCPSCRSRFWHPSMKRKIAKGRKNPVSRSAKHQAVIEKYDMFDDKAWGV